MSDQQTVSGAVEQVTAGPNMIVQMSSEFAKLLPRHIGEEKFTRWALSIIRRPDLAEVAKTDAGRLSIMSALMDCASLGLEPGRTYHLVPFGGTVTGIVDYQGEIELINRAQRCAVVAQLVREKDDFAMIAANMPPRHDTPDWFGDRGEVVGGYAYVDFGGSLYSQVIHMSEADFVKHRGKAKTKNVWDEWPEAMRLKTLVHQLQRWVPWSAEVRQP